MYIRDYSDGERLEVPMGYSGTLLEDTEKREPDEDASREDTAPVGAIPSSLSRGLGGLFGGSLFQGGLFEKLHIGKEELLIIAAALFLFLSKDGDKECAIMLALLLFIT